MVEFLLFDFFHKYLVEDTIPSINAGSRFSIGKRYGFHAAEPPGDHGNCERQRNLTAGHPLSSAECLPANAYAGPI